MRPSPRTRLARKPSEVAEEAVEGAAAEDVVGVVAEDGLRTVRRKVMVIVVRTREIELRRGRSKGIRGKIS